MPIEYFLVLVCFPFLATLTEVARFASKYMVDDWLIVVGLVTSPLNHSQVAADALSCSSTVKELALF
jgi:hypothetical protein